jgi:hypothetical protein
LRAALKQAELPIGWDGTAWCTTLRLAVRDIGTHLECAEPKADATQGVQKPQKPKSILLNQLLLAAGYLTTALAAMLGSPFWFDILGRLVNVRSALKPEAPKR